MPARVSETENGNYAVEHAVASGDVSVGDVFFEVTFGPLVFSTQNRAQSVANAINEELESREVTMEQNSAMKFIQDYLDKQ